VDFIDRGTDEKRSGFEAVLIFNPAEAKGDLKKRLESKELSRRIIGIETVDKMMDRQIAAKVRQRFLT